ncbi:hypothetical protein DZS_09150 [Dickeya ananatis]
MLQHVRTDNDIYVVPKGGIMGYLGSKGASGAYQKIIAAMPPHDTYIESHLGGWSCDVEEAAGIAEHRGGYRR